MRAIIFFLGVLCGMSANAAGMGDDPLLTMIKIDQLETDMGDDNDLVWEVQGWIGKDLDKIWFKTEGERVDDEIESAEIQLLYSRAISPYWDLQMGWRHDIKPQPNRDWLVLGVQGLAPYFFETDVALFVGESGIVGLRIEMEYELLLTQRWILSPEIEANFFSQDDRELGIGSGLSDIELGLRLRYEIKREFSPYIGIEWEKKLGASADFARVAGERISDSRWVMGVSLWF